MDLINGCSVLFSEVTLGWIGKAVYWLYESIGDFGLTVIVFTLILKTIVLPVDWWQRSVTRKNNRAMKRMKPQLEKLQKQFGNDQQAYQQKQMELYKQEGYSMIGACLPAILTLVIFMIVFSGFNETVRYVNYKTVEGMVEAYVEEGWEKDANGEKIYRDENGVIIKEVCENGTYINVNDQVVECRLPSITDRDAALAAATKYYEENVHGFLWIDNIFVADTWADPVVTEERFTSTGMGKLGITELPENIAVVGSYAELFQPLVEKYNKSGDNAFKRFFDFSHWNGYLILPILASLLSVLTMLMTSKNQPQPMPTSGDAQTMKQQQASQKMMQYLMPLMIGVFSFLYSAAFNIYMLISSLYSVLFQFIYSQVTKRKDAAEDARMEQEKYTR